MTPVPGEYEGAAPKSALMLASKVFVSYVIRGVTAEVQRPTVADEPAGNTLAVYHAGAQRAPVDVLSGQLTDPFAVLAECLESFSRFYAATPVLARRIETDLLSLGRRLEMMIPRLAGPASR
jgi:hypothetical protein